jgi:hypothetical protein
MLKTIHETAKECARITSREADIPFIIGYPIWFISLSFEAIKVKILGG